MSDSIDERARECMRENAKYQIKILEDNKTYCFHPIDGFKCPYQDKKQVHKLTNEIIFYGCKYIKRGK